MEFSAIPLDSVDEAALKQLVENQVSESKTLEYKSQLPGRSDGERKEFLADVSSFANTLGGRIIYGLEESGGAPTNICGLDETDMNAAKQRLLHMILDGLEPRIPVPVLQEIRMESSRFALVLEIARSWARPHVVWFQRSGKVYARTSTGKYQMDVAELRSAFTFAETVRERLRRFRLDRLMAIEAGETPLPLGDRPKLILHIIPFMAAETATTVDWKPVSKSPTDINLINGSVAGYRWNLDGFVTMSRDGPDSTGYVQLFRDGSIEAVDCWELSGPKVFSSREMELHIVRSCKRNFEILRVANVTAPYLVGLALTHVHGFRIEVENHVLWPTNHPIDRDSLIIPELLFEDPAVGPSLLLKPAFDAVWNSAGYPESQNYPNGKWIWESKK